MTEPEQAIDILLVEDSETDAELTREALLQGRVRNNVVHVPGGEEALSYLRCESPYEDAVRPDLILLDLNMPRLDGRDLLKIIRADEDLKVIPVVVLTTSSHDTDVLETYGLAANSYIVKPVDLTKFFTVIQTMQDFWVKVVKLPPKR